MFNLCDSVNSESQAINSTVVFTTDPINSNNFDAESILIPAITGSDRDILVSTLKKLSIPFVAGEVLLPHSEDKVCKCIFPKRTQVVSDVRDVVSIVYDDITNRVYDYICKYSVDFPARKIITMFEYSSQSQVYSYEFFIGDDCFRFTFVGKQKVRTAIAAAFQKCKLSNIEFSICYDYVKFLQDSHNKLMHCLNGNISFIFSVPRTDERVIFNYDDDMLRDDEKLKRFARMLHLTPQKFFELSILICCHNYLYVPYLVNCNGKAKRNLAELLYRGKKARFDWKKTPEKDRIGLWLVNFFIVSRFSRFLRCRQSQDVWNTIQFESIESQMFGSGLADFAKAVTSGALPQLVADGSEQLAKAEEVIAKADTSLVNANSLVDKVFGKLDVLFNNKFFQAFCKVGDSLSTVVDSITGFCESITSSVASSLGIDPSSKMISFVCALIFLIVLLVVIVAAGTLTTFICQLVKLATTAMFNRTCSLSPECESQCEVFPLYFECESQMETSVLLGTLFSMGVYLATGTKIDKPNFARDITSWGTILGTFCEKSPMFLDKCFQAATGSPLFSEATEFTEFLDDMYCVVFSENIDDLVCTDPSTADRVKKLFNQLQVFKKYIMDPRVVQGANQGQVAMLVRKLEDLYLKSKSAGDNVHNRPEPIALYLYGDTKQGKSRLSKYFPGKFYTALRKLPQFKDTPKFAKVWSNANVYAYNQSAQFQDKYYDQFCLSINEFAQFKDEATRSIVAEKLVNMIDIAATPFTSSDVREKGLHHMVSDMVMINSNVNEFDKMGLSRPDALARRLHYRLQVVRTGTFDPKKQNFDESWKFVLKHSNPQNRLVCAGELEALEGTGLQMDREYVFSEILASMVDLYCKRHNGESDEIDWECESQMMHTVPKKGSKFQPVKIPQKGLMKQYYSSYDSPVKIIPEAPCKQVAEGKLSEIAQKVFDNKPSDAPYLVPCGTCLAKVQPDYNLLTDESLSGLMEVYLGLMMNDPYWSSYVSMICVNEDIAHVRSEILRAVTYVHHFIFEQRYKIKCCQYQCGCVNGFDDDISPKLSFGRFRVEVFGEAFYNFISKSDVVNTVTLPAAHWRGKGIPFDFEVFCNRQREIIAADEKTLVEHFICIVQDTKLWFIKVRKQINVEIHTFSWVAGLATQLGILKIKSAYDSIRTVVRRVWDYIAGIVLSCVKWVKSLEEPLKEAETYIIEKGADILERVGTVMDDIKETVSSYNAKDWFWIFGIVLFVSASSLGIGASLAYLVSAVDGAKDNNVHRLRKSDDQLDSQGFYDKYKQQVAHSKLVPYGSRIIVESQMSADDKLKFYSKIINQNSRVLELVDDSGFSVETNCLFINTKHAVFVKHATRALVTTAIRVYDPIANTYNEFRHPQFRFRFPQDQRDCCFLDFEQEIEGTFISILKHLKTQPKRFSHTASRLMKMFDPVSKKIVEAYSTGKDVRYESSEVAVAKCYDKSGNIIETPQLGYYIVTGGGGFKGACGFPWFSEDAVDQNTALLGIHVAQWGENSICCPLFLKDFTGSDVYSQYNDSHQALIEQDPLFVYEAFSMEIPYPEEFTSDVSGVMPGTYPYLKPKRAEGSAMSSRLRPSSIFDFLPNHTNLVCPARMKPFRNDDGEMINPIKVFYKKYQQYCNARPCTFLYKLYERSPEDLWDGFEPKLKEDDGTVYRHKWATLEEVLFGSTEKGYESMDGTGSAGFKLRSVPGRGKRSDWFDKDTRTIDPYLRRLVEERVDALKKGKRIPQIVVDCLKDELREFDRVKLGKTRVFCVGEFVACIVAKMFFIDYLTKVKAHRAAYAASVGTNVHNSDWTYLGRTAFKFGRSRVFGGDLPTMDVSTQRVMAQFAIKYLKTRMILDPESVLVLEGLMYNVVTTLHVSGSWTYFFESGNSSGNYLTSWFNCFCCYTYMSCSYYYLRPEDETARFCEYIGIVVYGDDNLGSVHIKCYWFDNISLTRALKELFNLDFTDPSKGEIKESWLPESAQIFLSRKFVDDGTGIFRAPLEDSSLYGMLHYVRENDIFTPVEQLMTNVEVFAQEMSHFSVQEGEDRWQIVQEALKKAGLQYTKGTPKYWKQARLQNWSLSYW